jgi:DNA-binding IclR family transcriptional regulator
MKTYEKVIEALRDGQQTPEEVAINSMLPASQVSSTLRTLQNKGMVAFVTDQGRRFYYLTGVGL